MAYKTDLLIVKPGSARKQYGVVTDTLAAIEPPLWGIMLAAYARERGFSAAVLDAEAENLSPDEAAARIKAAAPLLCGVIAAGSNLSASTQAMPGAREVAEAIEAERLTGTKIVMMGNHPSALPVQMTRPRTSMTRPTPRTVIRAAENADMAMLRCGGGSPRGAQLRW